MALDQVEAASAAQAVKSSAGTDGERGSGDGLMLIHQLLEKHSSKLELSSVVGSGTTARFAIPFTHC
ncbi:MAG: ATP-binding protein [Lentimonas sp.]